MNDNTPTPPQREAMMIATAIREVAMYIDLSVFKEESFEIVIDMLGEDGFGKGDALRNILYRGLLSAMEASFDGGGRVATDDSGAFDGAPEPPKAKLRIVED